MSGKIGSITTDIIKNGLVFNMDAANRVSYIPNATTSFNTIDLSTSGSLENNLTFSSDNLGLWDFDGTDDFIKSNYTGTIPSISLWFKPDSTVTTGALGGVLMGFEDGGNYSGIYLGAVTSAISNELISIWTSDSANKSYYSQVGGTINTDWHNLIISHTGTQYNIYLDSINVWSANYGGNVGIINATRFDIGTRILSNNVNAPFDGKIANIQVYNRALSSTEVLHNYNALKDRFNL